MMSTGNQYYDAFDRNSNAHDMLSDLESLQLPMEGRDEPNARDGDV